MTKKRETVKHKLMVAFVIAFFISLAIYFLLRNQYDWVALIIPEFMGVSMLGAIITFALKKNTQVTTFLTLMAMVMIIGVFGFVYGRVNGVRFLVDLSPELLGSTGLGIILSLVFKKKVML